MVERWRGSEKLMFYDVSTSFRVLLNQSDYGKRWMIEVR
jgi:hypothetical protein